MRGLHRGGTRPSGARGRRSRGIYLAVQLSVPLAPLALLPLPRPLLLSCLSALFSGLITFRIKAKPSPGCEYNAPPSPLGEERGAGAPRGGRGRDRARRAARRRRGGLPGGGPGPPRLRLQRRRWVQVLRKEALPRTPGHGSRCPERESGLGLRASSKKGGEPERGLPLSSQSPTQRLQPGHPRNLSPCLSGAIGLGLEPKEVQILLHLQIVMNVPKAPTGAEHSNRGFRDIFKSVAQRRS